MGIGVVDRICLRLLLFYICFLNLPRLACRTEEDMKNRKDMVMNLRSVVKQMASALNMLSFGNEDILFGPEIMPAEATSRTAGLDNVGIGGQDEDLEKLEETIMNAKHVALAINEELGLYSRLIQVQRRLELLNKRAKRRCSCICILLSVIGIVILVAGTYVLIKYL